MTSYGAPNLDLPCDGCGKTLRQRLEEVLPAARGRYEAALLQELRGEDIDGCCYQHHHPFSPCTQEAKPSRRGRGGEVKLGKKGKKPRRGADEEE